jgi:signal transduction histidine kinase
MRPRHLLRRRADRQLAELRASQRRILEAGLGERRRLERDLHDGAQQRLVALSLQLQIARSRLESDPEEAGRVLDAAGEELRRAIEDLREVARGIHPAILTDRGLDAAVRALATRSHVPVRVAELPSERLGPVAEAAAYSVVAETLASASGPAEVSVVHDGGEVVVEVAAEGSEAVAAVVADRMAALEGTLEVHGSAGAGTLVRARFPCV